ncbi:hypothetical protein SLEP1_g31370 [Rubroshorea leprosula]|uniref:Uncharacterized protein n=1 Tax=Rubroshorea leprosula TaxID=152421 RepID=A0AAV5KAQ1_9ROSI|nr:hypothetical protein SLEP1_g31370 [Rubroshorea leprosula]
MNCIPRACRGNKAVDVASQRPIRKNQSQAIGSSSTLSRRPRETHVVMVVTLTLVHPHLLNPKGGEVLQKPKNC